jgi:hypothetical protein
MSEETDLVTVNSIYKFINHTYYFFFVSISLVSAGLLIMVAYTGQDIPDYITGFIVGFTAGLLAFFIGVLWRIWHVSNR